MIWHPMDPPLDPVAYLRAQQTNVPIELEALAYHGDPAVRLCVSRRRGKMVRLPILERLKSDIQPLIRAQVVDHLLATQAMVEEIASDPLYDIHSENEKESGWDGAWMLKQALAAHKYTPPFAQRVLHGTGKWFVLIELVNNLSCLPDLLNSMAHLPIEIRGANEHYKGYDKNKEIRKIARKRLGLPQISNNNSAK